MADLRYYDVILKPVITEASMSGIDSKKYTFLVHPDATLKRPLRKCLRELRLPRLTQ